MSDVDFRCTRRSRQTSARATRAPGRWARRAASATTAAQGWAGATCCAAAAGTSQRSSKNLTTATAASSGAAWWSARRATIAGPSTLAEGSLNRTENSFPYRERPAGCITLSRSLLSRSRHTESILCNEHSEIFNSTQYAHCVIVRMASH